MASKYDKCLRCDKQRDGTEEIEKLFIHRVREDFLKYIRIETKIAFIIH